MALGRVFGVGEQHDLRVCSEFSDCADVFGSVGIVKLGSVACRKLVVSRIPIGVKPAPQLR